MSTQLFGWIPPDERTSEGHEAHEAAMASMPAFSMPNHHDADGRHAIWQFVKQVLGRHAAYTWQLTGSCVGAGLDNMLTGLICTEIAQGDAEEYLEVWWPYHYGQGRRHAGLNGRGEGSFGSGQAKAVVQDGVFARVQAAGLPEFRNADGWRQLSRAVELEWSDGRAKNVDPWKSLGLRHPIKTAAPVRSTGEMRAALQSGYPLTIASMFGTRTIRPQGSPAVNVAAYDAQWPHQMHVDEAWKHPTLGWIFRIGNNWGPSAHPAPTQGEPPGGFYVTEQTMSRVLSERYTECFAFSAFQGFPVRELDWRI